MISAFVMFALTGFLMAFFAGSEMAFLSCNKLKVKHLADSGSRKAKLVAGFQQNPHWVVTTILIGTNVAHVTMASIFTYVMEVYFHVTNEWVVTLILAPLVIIFTETVPKDWFRQHADDVVYLVAPVLYFFERIFYPISKIILTVTDFFVGFAKPDLKRSPFVTKDEFRFIINESARGGILLEHEKHLIHTILDLGSTAIKEVMISLKHFPHLEISKKVKDAKELARQSQESLILVYEELPSIVVGVVHVFDLLFEDNEEASLAKYLRAPLFVSQDLSVEKTILLLQAKHSSYAVATNSNREVVGMVDIENLIRF